MGIRHKARVLAFKKLYSIDLNSHSKEDIEDIFDLEESEKQSELILFYKNLVEGTLENIELIDEIIDRLSKNWAFERIDKVDLSILRLSIYSLLFLKEIPARVVIDEAILIAKKYGSLKSYKFINGILNSLSLEIGASI